jgi:selenoprotein W-related protein
LTGALLNRYKSAIKEITLVPSDGGKFEVTVNNSLVYSKLQTGRHTEPSEVISEIEKLIN